MGVSGVGERDGLLLVGFPIPIPICICICTCTCMPVVCCKANNEIRFEAFDEPWKIQFNTEDEAWEDKWGLMDSARKLKPGLKIPDCDGKTV